MTRDEAIRHLYTYSSTNGSGQTTEEQHEEAKRIAIEALQQPERKTGKWIDQNGGGCCCSECGRYALDEPDGNFIHVSVKSNFCPNCGAKMGE